MRSDAWSPRSGVVVACLVASALLLAVAPAGMDATYSVVDNTTSESGAQGVDGAWVARAGFVLFGMAVVMLDRWTSRGPASRAAYVVFAWSMVGVAAFSARSWHDDAVYDNVEDGLHSVFANLMGFAFALGVVMALVARAPRERWARLFDWVALAASVILPLAMTIWDTSAGAFQRAMFAAAYLWFGHEAWTRLAPHASLRPAERAAVLRGSLRRS